jgi:hypothetical protein
VCSKLRKQMQQRKDIQGLNIIGRWDKTGIFFEPKILQI